MNKIPLTVEDADIIDEISQRMPLTPNGEDPWGFIDDLQDFDYAIVIARANLGGSYVKTVKSRINDGWAGDPMGIHSIY